MGILKTYPHNISKSKSHLHHPSHPIYKHFEVVRVRIAKGMKVEPVRDSNLLQTTTQLAQTIVFRNPTEHKPYNNLRRVKDVA